MGNDAIPAFPSLLLFSSSTSPETVVPSEARLPEGVEVQAAERERIEAEAEDQRDQECKRLISGTADDTTHEAVCPQNYG